MYIISICMYVCVFVNWVVRLLSRVCVISIIYSKSMFNYLFFYYYFILFEFLMSISYARVTLMIFSKLYMYSYMYTQCCARWHLTESMIKYFIFLENVCTYYKGVYYIVLYIHTSFISHIHKLTVHYIIISNLIVL